MLTHETSRTFEDAGAFLRYSRLSVLALVFAAVPLHAQTPADSGEPILVGPGVTQPRVLRKMEPEYSPEARAASVQGTVIFQIVINEKGRVTDVSVISPLGFGLDEQAQAALEKWEFAPGMKGGIPVKILAVVEVNFRFQGLWFDEKAEHRRTAFNVALQKLYGKSASPAPADGAVKSVLDLSRQKYAPAMYLAGLWKIEGEHVAKDVAEGLALIRKAADGNYAPALYDIAIRHIEGRDLPPDVENGLNEMRVAATLGSQAAQLYLGARYETGDGVPRDLDRARRYYRLCAAQGLAVCQYRLGRLLYDAPDRRERDYLQAVALFELANDQGLPEAKEPASREAPRLTAEQRKWVDTLKRQIVRK